MMIEMIQTPQSMAESALKLFHVLISISYLATFKPQLMPNAIPRSKNETKYVIHILNIHFQGLTPKFSQNMSIGSEAHSTCIH